MLLFLMLLLLNVYAEVVNALSSTRQFTGMPLELKETVMSNKHNRDLQTLARFKNSTKLGSSAWVYRETTSSSLALEWDLNRLEP